jgi:hypothetical protein
MQMRRNFFPLDCRPLKQLRSLSLQAPRHVPTWCRSENVGDVTPKSAERDRLNRRLACVHGNSKYPKTALIQSFGDSAGQGFRVSSIVANRFDPSLFEEGVKVL